MTTQQEFNYGIEVEPKSEFLIIKETLERLGVGNKRKKIMSPSCYILKKRDKYYIMHFKELLKLDGNTVDIVEQDMNRRDKIVSFLERWGLVEAKQPYNKDVESSVLIVPYNEKSLYDVRHKYNIGNY